MVLSRLYLGTAQMKHQESINYLKMANRMEAISTQIKTNMNNTKVQSFIYILFFLISICLIDGWAAAIVDSVASTADRQCSAWKGSRFHAGIPESHGQSHYSI